MPDESAISAPPPWREIEADDEYLAAPDEAKQRIFSRWEEETRAFARSVGDPDEEIEAALTEFKSRRGLGQAGAVVETLRYPFTSGLGAANYEAKEKAFREANQALAWQGSKVTLRTPDDRAYTSSPIAIERAPDVADTPELAEQEQATAKLAESILEDRQKTGINAAIVSAQQERNAEALAASGGREAATRVSSALGRLPLVGQPLQQALETPIGMSFQHNIVPAASGAAAAGLSIVPGAQGFVPQVAAPFVMGLSGSMVGGAAQEMATQATETPEQTAARTQYVAETETANPVQSLIGRTLAGGAFFRPSLSEFGKAYRGSEAARQNIAAGAALGAGGSVVGALASGQPITPEAVMEGLTVGAFLNRPTALGRALGFRIEVDPETLTVRTPVGTVDDLGNRIAPNSPAGTALKAVRGLDATQPTEGDPNAIQNRQTAPLHGDVLNAEGTPQGEGQVPADVGGEGIPARGQGEGLAARPSEEISPITAVRKFDQKQFTADDLGDGTTRLTSGETQITMPTENVPKFFDIPGPLARLQAELPAEPQPLGITPKPKAPDLPAKPASSLPNVEKRWQAARGIQQQGIWQRLKEGIRSVGRAFTRADPLLEPKTDGEIIDAVRMIRGAPETARGQAIQFLQGITQPLGRNGHELMSRTIILRDLVRDLDAGLYAGKSELPFGYKDRAEVEADLNRFEAEVAKPDLASTNVRDAIEQRQKIMLGLRDEMVSRGLLPEEVQNFDDYFHRQVLQYYNELEAARPGGQPDARVKQKGFQKARVGGTKDYSTSYLESEYEVMSQMMQQIRVHDELQRVKAASDIRPRLEGMAATARAAGDPDAKWQDFIPDDYVTWQPERGRYFYPAKTVAEKTLNDFLSGARDLSADDFREAVAVGGLKPEWVLPERVAQTLDNLNRRPESTTLGNISSGLNNAWKKWQLFNPLRLSKYVINNQSGDMDIVMAYRPEIFGEVPGAEKEMWRVAQGKTTSALIQEARAHGVLDAGWTASEIPDVHQHSALARLEAGDRNVIQRTWDKYWGTATNIARWREGVLRLAAYKWFKKQLQSGKTDLYGASRREEVDAVQGIENKAAKLARELIGDYGNVSQAGHWIREKMIPFWSWMEINAPRYYRIFKNIPREAGGGSYARVGGALATNLARSVATPAKMASLYGLIWLFNNSTPERRQMAAELGDTRGQMHLVLGRDENGKVMSLRFQGALSDALSWAGLQDAPEDIAKLASGQRTPGEQAQEMALATPEKIIGAAMPIPKTAMEVAGKFTLYPEPFSPRPVRDRWQHLARGLSLGSIYDYFADIPQRANSPQDVVRSAVLYTTDPQEQAYFGTRKLVNDFLTKQGREKQPFGFTDRQNAIHYFKLAAQKGNQAQAQRWWNAYIQLGGNRKTARESIDASSPTAGLNKALRAEFIDSLTPEQQKVLEQAEEWNDKTQSASLEMLNEMED